MPKTKIWLVTGGSSGLGKEISLAAMKAGNFVICTFRKPRQIEEFNSEHGESGLGVHLDLNDQTTIRNRIEEIKKRFGRIDVLVNNAGLGFAGAIEEASIDEVRNVFESNVFGTLKLTQEVLPIMRHQKNGHIIQISSHAGVKAFAGFGVYNASKFALEGFSEAMAQEVSPLGIHVTIVEPGPFRTNFAGGSLKVASNKIDDYNSTAAAFTEKLLSVNGKQEGDPFKAAEAIVKYIDDGNQQLRLVLGKVPLTTIQMKIDSLQNDLEKSRHIAQEVIFEP